jgi:hypothetical protein
MAIGTAVKKLPGMGTLSATLPAQAIIKDKDTWISTDNNIFNTDAGEASSGS